MFRTIRGHSWMTTIGQCCFAISPAAIFLQMETYACPTTGEMKEIKNDTVASHRLQHEEQLSVEVINPGRSGIQIMVSFDGE